MAWSTLVQYRDILLDNHCDNLRTEHDYGLAEAEKTQPCTYFERQRLGFEPENFGQHQVRRHFDRHCKISYREDERPVHHEGSFVEEDFEMVHRNRRSLRGGLFHLAEGYEAIPELLPESRSGGG